MAPPALALRDQMGRGGAAGHRLHCLCTALFFSGRECLPQSLGVGSTWAGTVHVFAAQLMARGCALGQHREASPALLPANLVTELVTRWGLWATLDPSPGLGGGSRDGSAACEAWTVWLCCHGVRWPWLSSLMATFPQGSPPFPAILQPHPSHSCYE